MNQTFKHLGFGLGFRSCHYDEILTERPKDIDWLEVISENFMDIGGRPLEVLLEASKTYPIAFHGVSLSVGSPEPTTPGYLKSLKKLCDLVNPALVSDHLCFTSLGRHNSHDLLPIPYTTKSLAVITDKINQVQDSLGRRFMLENPSAYVAYDARGMPEALFLAELTQRTGCGILLDVNNLTVNEYNLNQDPLTYLSTLPHDCVGQIHLAGHSVQTNDTGTVRIDTHDHPILPETWELFRFARGKWPNASPMIEWDDKIPALSELRVMLNHARDLGPIALPKTEIVIASAEDGAPADSMRPFFDMVVDSDGINSDDRRLAVLEQSAPVPPLLGTRVYNNAYFCRLRDVLKSEFPTLATVTTEDGFDALAQSYLSRHPSSSADIGRVGSSLPDFLSTAEFSNIEFGVAIPVLSEIARLDQARSFAFAHEEAGSPVAKSCLMELSPDDWEVVKFTLTKTLTLISNKWRVSDIWNGTQDGQPPSKPKEDPERLIVWRDQSAVYHQSVSDFEGDALVCFQSGKTFKQTVATLASALGTSDESAAESLVPHLISWFDRGLIYSQSIS